MAPINTITIQDSTYLLVWVGDVDHPVATKDDDTAVAIADLGLDRLNPAYDRAEMVDRRWNPKNPVRTVRLDHGAHRSRSGSSGALGRRGPCHRGAVVQDVPPGAGSPLPGSDADRRAGRHLARCIQEMELWGEAMVDGVPGDQAELLRRRARTECRRRGLIVQSFARDQRVIILSENSMTHERKEIAHRDSHSRMTGRAEGLAEGTWHFGWLRS